MEAHSAMMILAQLYKRPSVLWSILAARKKGAEFITGNVLGMDPQVGELIK